MASEWCDGKRITRNNERELNMEWKKLVGPGYVWVVRLNALTWVGVVVMLLFALSLVRDIHGNTAGLALALDKMDTAPASWWERFKASPIETIKATVHGDGLTAAPARPIIDQNAILAIQPVSTTTQIKLDVLTKPGELKTYIEDNLAALNKTGKLSAAYPACEPLTDLRQPWVASSGQPDTPRCLNSASGNTVWMVSLISDGNQFAPWLMSWIGVFHKGEKTWEYRNVEGLGGGAKLPGYKSVNPDMVPFQVAADFPYLVAKTEGVVK